MWQRQPVSLRRLLSLTFCLFWISLASAFAQPQPVPDDALNTANADLDRVQASIEVMAQDDAGLGNLRTETTRIQDATELIAQQLTPKLAAFDARLKELGPEPAADAPPETPEVQRERADLTRERGDIDARIKRARLLSVAAGQAGDQITAKRRALFDEKLWQRTKSVLSPSFWMDLNRSLPRDASRLQDFLNANLSSFVEVANPRNIAILGGAGLLALFLMVPARRWLEASARQIAIGQMPANRLRRSALAMWFLVTTVLAPSLAAIILYAALISVSALTDGAEQLAWIAATMVFVASYITGLGRAILMDRGSWRLAPISDETVQRIRHFPFIIGIVAALGTLLEQLNSLIGASLPTTIAGSCAIALVTSLAIGSMMWTLTRIRRKALKAKEGEAPPQALFWGLVAVAVWLALAATLAFSLGGYVALGVFIVRQISWLAIIGGTVYLLMQFTDDFFTSIFSGDGPLGRFAYTMIGLNLGTVDQVGLLLSGISRVVILFLAVAATLAPFGAGTSGLPGRLNTATAGFKVGDVTISPGAILGAVAIFILGITIVRGVHGWLSDKFLPKTSLDAAVRTSVSTTFRYIGLIVSAAAALGYAGLNLGNVALIASALSVGIGFGLQAIVQNFISGLILLAERPIKIGDWITVGDAEGDVRHINVRATQIELMDRSTLIVPNSELITKSVRNKTLTNSIARLQMRFGVLADNDPAAVRDLLLAAMRSQQNVLTDPSPAVFIDGLDEGKVFFNAIAFVSNPRSVYSTRSALWFDVLQRFHASGVRLI
jgi:potassium efflux system protein